MEEFQLTPSAVGYLTEFILTLIFAGYLLRLPNKSRDGWLILVILAFMRIAGSACLACALAMVILLVIPFRKGDKWSYWAIPAIALTASVPTLLARLYVGQHTAASPPYIPVLAGIVLLITGFSYQ